MIDSEHILQSRKSDKILPAYSTMLYKIIKKNRYTHTYEIEKLEDDQRLSRQGQKVHHRIVKRISKRISFDKKYDDNDQEESMSNGESQNPDIIEVQLKKISDSKLNRTPSRYNLRFAKIEKF